MWAPGRRTLPKRGVGRKHRLSRAGKKTGVGVGERTGDDNRRKETRSKSVREGDALRENLRRRKAQGRARGDPKPAARQTLLRPRRDD